MAKDAAPPYDDLREQHEVESIMSPEGGPAVIDFWSPTCGPCMAMADDFAHVAGQFDRNEVRFCKINTMENPELAMPFNIRSVPTILFVANGKVLDGVVGRMNAATLGKKAEWLLAKAKKGPGILSRLFG